MINILFIGAHRLRIAGANYICKLLWFPQVLMTNYRLSPAGSANQLSGKKVAIFAILERNSKAYELSIQRVIGILESLSYSVLVISEGAISPKILNILNRPNVLVMIKGGKKGRDFACYQAGISYLSKRKIFHSVDSLLLINDSMYWKENAEKWFEDLESLDFGCLFLTTHPRVHAQSFFLVFSNRVTQLPTFRRFWKSYVPLNARAQAINRGEVHLTKLLMKERIFPKPIINRRIIEDSIRNRFDHYSLWLNLAQDPSFNIYPPSPLKTKEGQPQKYVWPNNHWAQKDNERESIVKQWILDRVHFRAPHTLGFLLHQLENVPIKFDMYKYYTLGNIALNTDADFYEDQVSRLAYFMSPGLVWNWKRRTHQV